jgi:hypothetical protein
MTTFRRFFILLFRLHYGVYIFLSAIFISQSINLFTSIFAVDSPPARYRILMVSASFSLLSAVFWTILAWRLEAIERVSYGAASQSALTTWQSLINSVVIQLVILLSIALGLSILSILSLLWNWPG